MKFTKQGVRVSAPGFCPEPVELRGLPPCRLLAALQPPAGGEAAVKGTNHVKLSLKSSVYQFFVSMSDDKQVTK